MKTFLLIFLRIIPVSSGSTKYILCFLKGEDESYQIDYSSKPEALVCQMIFHIGHKYVQAEVQSDALRINYSGCYELGLGMFCGEAQQ